METRVFATIPESIPTATLRSVLEGPSFDRNGNLYVVNVHGGRIFRISPDARVEKVFQYDGVPNGLKIHRDGRFFVADHRKGLLCFDPEWKSMQPVFDKSISDKFHGLNDLVFASNGDLYFTDQGETGLHDPTGRLWRLSASGRLDVLLDNVPSPNGLVLTPDERSVLLAVTRANAIWRVPLSSQGTVGRVGTFIQMSGGNGPDGLAIDEAGNLAVAHVGMGSAWLFSDVGRPLAEIRSRGERLTTNLAFGGPDRTQLFITAGETASILTASLTTPGLRMFSHAP